MTPRLLAVVTLAGALLLAAAEGDAQTTAGAGAPPAPAADARQGLTDDQGTADPDPLAADPPAARGHVTARQVASFLAGGALGLGVHEVGHFVADVAFDANPGVEPVEFGFIPFFAITHRDGLSPRQEFVIASAGFWMQHASSEWVLTRRPGLRLERAPMAKGLLAFNVLASAAYGTAALARTGPPQRDTRTMAATLGVDERWVGGLVLVPALADAWRYYHPDSRWARWVSRSTKIGMVLLTATVRKGS